MDQKDEQILNLLKKNAKLTTQQLSNRTGIPVTTIHNRIKRMEKQGIIRNYSIWVDYDKLGKKIAAIIMVSLDHKAVKQANISLKDVMKKILAISGVHRVWTVTGSRDMVLRVRAADMTELDNMLSVDLMNLGFIERTETMIITNELQ